MRLLSFPPPLFFFKETRVILIYPPGHLKKMFMDIFSFRQIKHNQISQAFIGCSYNSLIR